jgi:hypothetical protein
VWRAVASPAQEGLDISPQSSRRSAAGSAVGSDNRLVGRDLEGGRERLDAVVSAPAGGDR